MLCGDEVVNGRSAGALDGPRPPDGRRSLFRSARAWTAVLAAGGSAGCADAPVRDEGAPAEAVPAVALLTSGPVSDAGWHAGAYEGLQRIGDSLGWRTSHQQTRTPADFDEAFASYAESGYDLVFGHGFEYLDAAERAAATYPDVTFVVSSGSRTATNVVPLIFRLEEAAYLAGMAAGGISLAGVLGMVGGVEIPPAKGTFMAFEAGVRAVNPDATVLETFTGSWDDVAAAKEAAAAQLRRGADVLIHNVDAASFGVFQAVREAREQGRTAWAFGMNRDQNDVAPDVIAGSALIDIPAVFLQTALAWRDGTLDKALRSGLAGGAVDFVQNPALPGLVPAAVAAQIAQARKDIVSGALNIPRIRYLEDEPPADSSDPEDDGAGGLGDMEGDPPGGPTDLEDGPPDGPGDTRRSVPGGS